MGVNAAISEEEHNVQGMQSSKSVICEKNYQVALGSARREMCRLKVFSVAGMEAHDFAIEAVLLSMKWGGSKYVARRAKLLVLEKFRHETGARRVSSSRRRVIQSDSMNFEANPERDHSHKDFEELLEVIEIPDRLKDIVRRKVHHGMKNNTISRHYEIHESSLSQYIGDWSDVVIDIVSRRMSRFGIDITSKIRKRRVRCRIRGPRMRKKTDAPLR